MTAASPAGKDALSVVFVCQGGPIEIQAALLATSLHEYLPPGHELVACIPSAAQGWPQPRRTTLDLLDELGCRTAEITNTIDRKYGLANKIGCLGIEAATERVLFLDSDIVCMRRFDPDELPRIPFAAKPADQKTFGADTETWEQCYREAGLDMPADRVTTTVSREDSPLYFNSGVILTSRAAKLNEAWVANLRKLRGHSDSYFAEQASLVLAVVALGLPRELLDEEHNYPANLKPVNASALPVLCHYHQPDVIVREPVLRHRVHELADRHPALKNLIGRDPEWAKVLRPPRRRRGWRALQPPPAPWPRTAAPRIPELVLSGIPRSGTSYLCRLLDQHSNCVVINEPPEAVLTLQEMPVPWPLARFFRSSRAKILNGETVLNKIEEDTAREDVRVPTRPSVRAADFVLGIKNTQSFLCRIAAIREAMPDARIVASVRNPYDTIASWKSSFPHLRDADVTDIPVGHTADPYLTGEQREALAQIAATNSTSERRAKLWAFLAAIITENRDGLITVRYEDLILRPRETMERILGDWQAGTPRHAVEPSTIRRKSGVLDHDDLQAIGDICLPAAQHLDLNTDVPA